MFVWKDDASLRTVAAARSFVGADELGAVDWLRQRASAKADDLVVTKPTEPAVPRKFSPRLKRC
jgi:hypothetical protein